MTTNTGGPAFPAFKEQSDGMTLRDYAAIKAMQGDLVSGVHPDNFDATAKRAYKMADAMLEARRA
jgi:hypothetical protein